MYESTKVLKYESTFVLPYESTSTFALSYFVKVVIPLYFRASVLYNVVPSYMYSTRVQAVHVLQEIKLNFI